MDLGLEHVQVHGGLRIARRRPAWAHYIANRGFFGAMQQGFVLRSSLIAAGCGRTAIFQIFELSRPKAASLAALFIKIKITQTAGCR
jgi:hypothetical protein